MAEAVTQKDFELFKQEIRFEIKSAKDSIAKEVNDFVGKKLNFLIGVVILFILAYAAYFEWTHNAISKVNQERAAFELEKTIMASLNQMMEIHDKKEVKRGSSKLEKTKKVKKK